jgi:hypothetical protein
VTVCWESPSLLPQQYETEIIPELPLVRISLKSEARSDGGQSGLECQEKRNCVFTAGIFNTNCYNYETRGLTK